MNDFVRADYTIDHDSSLMRGGRTLGGFEAAATCARIGLHSAVCRRRRFCRRHRPEACQRHGSARRRRLPSISSGPRLHESGPQYVATAWASAALGDFAAAPFPALPRFLRQRHTRLRLPNRRCHERLPTATDRTRQAPTIEWPTAQGRVKFPPSAGPFAGDARSDRALGSGARCAIAPPFRRRLIAACRAIKEFYCLIKSASPAPRVLLCP